MSQPTHHQIPTPDGISWHVVTTLTSLPFPTIPSPDPPSTSLTPQDPPPSTNSTTTKPHLILLPSGEGDYLPFIPLFPHLSPHFTITTFDMPGFSLTTCPISALTPLSPYKIASQISTLMSTLNIPSASIYGSSSGGTIALAMLAKYPDMVDRVLVHEVPLKVIGALYEWQKLPDEEIVEACKKVFREQMNENQELWDALGPAYHARLARNYVTWVRYYAPVIEEMDYGEELKEAVRRKALEGGKSGGEGRGGEKGRGGGKGKGKGVAWSLGGQMPLSWFWENVVWAGECGVEVDVLDCRHFPCVSIPGKLAEWIRGVCGVGEGC